MRAQRTAGLMAVCVVAVMSSWLCSTGAPAAPPTRPSVYWGVLINGVPFDMSKLQAFEANVGRQVSIVHWGQPWVLGSVFQPFPAAGFESVRAHGSIPMLNWGSWQLGAGLSQPLFQLSDIYQGRYDAYLRSWATAAKSWGHPFFLRFDHEMNGWWFPWSEQANGNQSGDYVRAWRHVHDIFTQVGATNVTWVWCVNVVDSPRSTPIAGLYPGDRYVDWVAVDGYNFGTDRNNSWQAFDEILRRSYGELLALAPTKPLMIAEVASSEDGGPLGRPASKAAWIGDAYLERLPVDFPKVKAVVWFNWNDNDPALDWPIESSPFSVAAFKQAIASGYYAANTFANLSASPIPPLDRAGQASIVWLPVVVR